MCEYPLNEQIQWCCLVTTLGLFDPFLSKVENESFNTTESAVVLFLSLLLSVHVCVWGLILWLSLEATLADTAAGLTLSCPWMSVLKINVCTAAFSSDILQLYNISPIIFLPVLSHFFTLIWFKRFLKFLFVFAQGVSVVWDWFTPTSRAPCHPSPSKTCLWTSIWSSLAQASLSSFWVSSSAVILSGEGQEK